MAKRVEKTQVEEPVEQQHDRFDNVEGRFARIVTRGRVVGGGSIFYRAHIIKATTNALTVTFYGKPKKKARELTSGELGPELNTELIKKIDIVDFRLLES